MRERIEAVRRRLRILCRVLCCAAVLSCTAALGGCGRSADAGTEAAVSEVGTEAGTMEASAVGETAAEAAEDSVAADGTGANAADESAASDRLPSSYDYRLVNRAGKVRNQENLSTCWAFAALGALETTLLPEESHSFSVDHMTLRNSFGLSQSEGGDYTKAMAYLLAWQGPVREEDDPYGDGVSPENLEAVKHVQEIWILPEKGYQDMKKAVFLYGGVQTSIYMAMADSGSESVFYQPETAAYCYTGTQGPNHDVVIVGWDDDYPKENFRVQPKGDGAFLCAGSWGETFGEQGFFYVSYFDKNIGLCNVLYRRAEEPDNYDRIYQTDLCGWVGQLGYGKETAWFANVYEAQDDERLEAVGFYAVGPDTEYEVYVAGNLEQEPDFSHMRKAAAGTLDYAGFYTIELEEEAKPELETGERYGVIVRVTTPGTTQPVAIECSPENGKTVIDLEDGEGYSSPQGSDWERVETTQNCNICLKAYTLRQTLSEE